RLPPRLSPRPLPDALPISSDRGPVGGHLDDNPLADRYAADRQVVDTLRKRGCEPDPAVGQLWVESQQQPYELQRGRRSPRLRRRSEELTSELQSPDQIVCR